MTNQAATVKFEAGKTYWTRSIVDSDSIFSWTVVRRTEKSVWLIENEGDVPQRKKINVWDGKETCMPLGSYSMAPSIDASREQDAPKKPCLRIVEPASCYEVITSNPDEGLTLVNAPKQESDVINEIGAKVGEYIRHNNIDVNKYSIEQIMKGYLHSQLRAIDSAGEKLFAVL